MVVVPQDAPTCRPMSRRVADPQLATPATAAALLARHPQGGGRAVVIGLLGVEGVGVGHSVMEGVALGNLARAWGGAFGFG